MDLASVTLDEHRDDAKNPEVPGYTLYRVYAMEEDDVCCITLCTFPVRALDEEDAFNGVVNRFDGYKPIYIEEFKRGEMKTIKDILMMYDYDVKW